MLCGLWQQQQTGKAWPFSKILERGKKWWRSRAESHHQETAKKPESGKIPSPTVMQTAGGLTKNMGTLAATGWRSGKTPELVIQGCTKGKINVIQEQGCSGVFWQDHFKAHASNGSFQYGQTIIRKVSFWPKSQQPQRPIPKYLAWFHGKCWLEMCEDNRTGKLYDINFSVHVSLKFWKHKNTEDKNTSVFLPPYLGLESEKSLWALCFVSFL